MPNQRKKRDNKQLVIFLSLIMLLVGCRSSKEGRKTSDVDKLIPLIEQMQAMQPVADNLSAKTNFEAIIDAKSVSAGGTINIEKGVGLQISATALGLFEVARIDATPVELLLINKVGKEYARSDFSPVSLLGQVGVTYDVLQSLFMNEPFLPAGENFYTSISKVELYRENDNIVAKTPIYKNIYYIFTFDSLTGELRRTEGVYNNKIRVICNYSDFKSLKNRTFPEKLEIEVQGIEKPIKLNFKLSNIKEGRGKFTKSNLSSYKKIDVNEIIKVLTR